MNKLNVFFRFQLSSFTATLVDFTITIILKEVFGIWYMISTSVGSIAGGITNFLLNRNWVFRATGSSTILQVIRYLIGWGGSIVLNVSGVFLLTHFGHLNYIISKIIVSFVVGIFFNYILQRFFIFRTKKQSAKDLT